MFQGHPPLASDLTKPTRKGGWCAEYLRRLTNLDRKYERQGEEIYICW